MNEFDNDPNGIDQHQPGVNSDFSIPNRDEHHGGMALVGITSQRLKYEMRQGRNWSSLRYSEAEALDMIAHKIARILSGADPHNREHWEDVAGYAIATMRAHP